MKLDLRTSLPATLFALALTFGGLGCDSDGAPPLDGGAGKGGSGGRGGGSAGTVGTAGTGGAAGTSAAGGRGGTTGVGGTGGAAGASGGRGGATGGSGGAAGASGGRGGTTGVGGTGGATGGTGGAAGASGGRGGTTGVGGTGGATGGTGGAAGTTGGTGGAAGTTGGTGGGAAGEGGGGAAGTAAGGGGAAGTGSGGGGAAGTSGPDAGPDGSTTDGPTCQNECTLAATRCDAGGGFQTCVTGSSGCTVWGAVAACPGIRTCIGGACACPAPPAGCSAAGTNCLNGAIVTCTPDAQGCLAASSAACPTRTACTGAAGTAACTCVHECDPVGNFCYDGDTVGTCGTDANNCRYMTGTSPCVGVSTCSAGACVCPGAVAVPVAGGACATASLGATACAGTDILTCVTQTGSNCPIWEVSTSCASSGLTCATQGGTPACQCPVNSGTTVYVDPEAGSDVADSTHPYPTGIQTPAQCRFGSLSKGLATVGSPGTVTAISAAPPVTFALEDFPVMVPAGVTLRTADSTPIPANYRINFGDGSVTSAIVLGGGSTFQGFSVVSDASNANGATNVVSCSSGTVTINGADMDGADTVPFAFNAEGTCSATLTSTGVRQSAMAGINVGTSGTVNVVTGEVVNSLVGIRQTDGTLNISNATMIQLNTVAGILTTGSNLPNLVIGDSTVQRNVGVGINVTRGSISAINTEVLETRTGAGIILASGASIMHTLNNVAVDSDAGAGVVVTNGIVTATSLASDGNGTDGLVVNGGTVTVNGGLFDGNAGSGIVGAGGTVTITGNPSLGSNNRGLALLGSIANVLSANIHNNTTDGIFVDSASGVLLTIGTAGGSSAVALNANTRDGIRIDRSPVTTSAANSVVLENVTITGNGGAGVNLTGSAGAAANTIRNCTVTGNGGIGIAVAGAATTVAIQNNNVASNNTGGGAADNIGGIRFATPVALTSFIGNRVHSNAGDEVGFAAPATGSYTLGTGACNDGANFFYCYGGGNVGLRIIGATTVDASNTHWTSAAPAAAVDYSVGAGGSATVNPACSTAPACP